MEEHPEKEFAAFLIVQFGVLVKSGGGITLAQECNKI
jgi:hypothetical protein